MRTPLPPQAPGLLLSLLILGSGLYATGLDLNDTSSGKEKPFSQEHRAGGLEVSSGREMSSGRAISPVSAMPSASEPSSGTDHDDSAEVDNEPQVPSVQPGSARTELEGKPNENNTEGEKTSEKPKRKKKGGKNGKNKRNKKKKTPCDAEFQNFCIHGECKYIENLKVVTCKCDHDYFGERCGEKLMKTHSMVDSDLSQIALAAIVAFVFAVSFTAITVVITVQFRKRYFGEYKGEAEEQKKLRQENGNVHAVA